MPSKSFSNLFGSIAPNYQVGRDCYHDQDADPLRCGKEKEAAPCSIRAEVFKHKADYRVSDLLNLLPIALNVMPFARHSWISIRSSSVMCLFFFSLCCICLSTPVSQTKCYRKSLLNITATFSEIKLHCCIYFENLPEFTWSTLQHKVQQIFW